MLANAQQWCVKTVLFMNNRFVFFIWGVNKEFFFFSVGFVMSWCPEEIITVSVFFLESQFNDRRRFGFGPRPLVGGEILKSTLTGVASRCPLTGRRAARG